MIPDSELIDAHDLFVLRITLNGVEPAVTREVIVTGDFPLPLLHLVIQVCMGWENSHHHEFQKGLSRYGTPNEDFPEMDVTDYQELCVIDLLPEDGEEISYVYDFGDCWDHTIHLVTTIPDSEGDVFPVCIEGAMACPPEDVGGLQGFEEFKAIVSDPEHPKHDELLDWVGWGWDADYFNIHETNVILGRVFPAMQMDDDLVH